MLQHTLFGFSHAFGHIVYVLIDLTLHDSFSHSGHFQEKLKLKNNNNNN